MTQARSHGGTTRITRLLIANRGEIALRIMRTAQGQGIVCVAVFSEPDADALFVTQADLGVALRGVTSAETYLDTAQILAAAKASGADAIHPGYGFLSENAEFAAAVQAAGLVWVGPRPDSITAMSAKVPAKALVAAAGVPLVPGAELAADVAEAELLNIGAQVGYPLMVKASAGGGGKGMRIVAESGELVAAVATAGREAAASFGDATVFLERYLAAARHIEVQVFGDSHGNVIHLLERECSIQRRHQKVIEEAPAPFLPESVRGGLHTAAVAAAKAVSYLGAGTVEFLVDGHEYFFLEMNTRLQVEHPVTEEILGIDLVDWQLQVAQGAPLPQVRVEPNGHAIEARLYAENPAADDLPCTGVIEAFDFDSGLVRVESGVAGGSVVSPHYDPMLAKIIAHGRDREEAAAKLARGLRTATLHGPTTNRDMLAAVVSSPSFLEQATTTAFLTENAHLRTTAPDLVTARLHALAAAAGVWHVSGEQVPVVSQGVATPGWRNVQQATGVQVHLTGERSCAAVGAGSPEAGVTVHRRDGWGGEWGIAVDGDPIVWLTGTRIDVRACGPGQAEVVAATAGGLTMRLTVSARELTDPGSDSGAIYVDGVGDHTVWALEPRSADSDELGSGAGPSTPVPGTITVVAVAAGQAVAVGDVLVVLEAMKMEHRIVADRDGVVAEVLVEVGESVEAHQVVVALAGGEDES